MFRRSSADMIGDSPEKFIGLMKMLFDILDDGNTGFVLLKDLERWWDAETDDDAPAAVPSASLSPSPHLSVVPSDVLVTLKDLTPPDGRLSFETFIAGVKMWLIRQRKLGLLSNNRPALNTRSEISDHLNKNLPEKRRPLKTLNAEGSGFKSFNHQPIRAVGPTENKSTKLNGHIQQLMQKNHSMLAVNEAGVVGNVKPGDRPTVNRRHTLTSGISYNFIPMMKLMQQEKELLQSGLNLFENARRWYRYRLVALEEKQKNFEKTSLPSDYSVEADKERIQHERLRITIINRELDTLTSGSEKGLPEQLNLVTAQSQHIPSNIFKELETLKVQNQKLNQELVQKTKKIEKLEHEKIILVKDMFQARSSNKNISEMTLI